MYYFDAPSNLDGGHQGANHCSDNSYEFGWPVVNKWHGPEEEELSRLMMSYWASFAKTGNPNSENYLKWNSFNPSKRNFVRFDLGDTSDAREYFRHEWASAWSNLMIDIENS